MGKSVGLIGEISGKVGNVVFYTRNGVQVARVYVKNPSDPKSSAQSVQRLKMSLAGRLSSIVPYAALEGFGGTKSVRRSKFTQHVLLNSSVADGRASIAESNILFSEGSLPLLLTSSVRANASSGNVRSLTITTQALGEGEVLPSGYGERFVVLFLNTELSQFDYAVTGLLNLPGAGETSAETVVNVKVGNAFSIYRASVFLYPFAAADDASAVRGMRSTYIGTEEGTVFVDEVTGEALSVQMVYGRSLRNATVVLNPAS